MLRSCQLAVMEFKVTFTDTFGSRVSMPSQPGRAVTIVTIVVEGTRPRFAAPRVLPCKGKPNAAFPFVSSSQWSNR